MKRITVTVPASTSNLGSGFDTLGLAVNLHLRLVAEEAKGIMFEAGSPNHRSAEALILEAIESISPRIPGMRVKLENAIPIGRGLGASAALRVAVIAAVSTLEGRAWNSSDILEAAYALEHHPDNVSPAIYGGFTVSGRVRGKVRCQRVEVGSELKFVTLLPEFELPTGEARKLLPEMYSRADAAHALNRAALIAAALAKKDYPGLRGLFDDRLHQPYRERLIPELGRVIAAGENAGAIGGFLSGAGSGIICLALENEEAVARAMHRVMPGARIEILSPDNRGMIISEAERAAAE